MTRTQIALLNAIRLCPKASLAVLQDQLEISSLNPRRLETLMSDGLVLRFGTLQRPTYELSKRGRALLAEVVVVPAKAARQPAEPRLASRQKLVPLGGVEGKASPDAAEDPMMLYDQLEEIEKAIAPLAKVIPKEILDHFGMTASSAMLAELRRLLKELGWQRPRETGSRYWTRPVPKAKTKARVLTEVDDEAFVTTMQTGLWTRLQLQERLGLTETQVRLSLGRLETQGRVQPVGRGSSTMYFLPGQDKKRKKAKTS